MSETPEGLQKTFTAFENYCNNWKIHVKLKLLFSVRDDLDQISFLKFMVNL